ncbi:M48 family metalloprotease [Candidatus Poribacteria bacterium]|nr:M48 family metalloprotease [Candidatus Poribacteria bacterium]
MRKNRQIPQLTLFVTLFVATGSGLFGCAGRISDINIFTDTQEVQLGKQFSREIEKELKIYSDPVVTAYIDQLGQHLVNHSQRQNITYHFKVVNTEVVNAFAVPGGYLYVNIGLIRAAANESELAGVIGHEIGHVVGKHGVKQMTRQLGLAAVAQLALGEDQSKIKQMVANLATNGVLMKYSRDAEREADIYAVQEMYDAGVDPEGMATFFEKLLKLQKSKPSKLQQLFSTHPLTAERIAAVRAQIARLPRKSNLKTDSRRFHQIKKRLPPPSKTPTGKR